MTRRTSQSTVSVSESGEMVIPSRIRARLGLEHGGLVTVDVVGHKLVVEPIAAERSDWRSWRGVLADVDAVAEHVADHEAEVDRDAQRP